MTVADVETVAAAMLDAGLAPKTVRNVITFMHSVFEHAIDRGWTTQNPVRRASRPKRRRGGDANPDIQFLTVPELEAVLRAIPDEVVVRAPAPTRRGRAGSAPPVPPDVLGPVIRPVVLTAAMTRLRQSELLGLRWRDVDWTAQRIRVRNAWVRGEHSAEGKSDLSTRRSVPIADRLAREMDRWSQRTLYGAHDLVFAPRSRADRSTARSSRGALRRRASRRACARSGSTTSGIPSRGGSRRPASQCAPSRSSSATPTPRRHRSTPTTRRARMVEMAAFAEEKPLAAEPAEIDSSG